MAPGQPTGSRARTRRPGVARIVYTDLDGYWYLVDVPVGHEDRPDLGVRVGPPDLSDLGLPQEIAVELNHQLYNRELYTREDARQRPQEVTAALQAAYRVSATKLLNLYQTGG